MFFDPWLLHKIFGRLKAEFCRPPEPLPCAARRVATLPVNGPHIPVETALNSRCTSDATGNQNYHHWGMFATDTKLAPQHIAGLVDMANALPGFFGKHADVAAHENILSCSVAIVTNEITGNILMLSSGMQQQAIGLMCAALGIGMVFQNCGMDGTFSANQIMTTKIAVHPMLPSYDGSYWTTAAPTVRRPWNPGNLPDPDRRGKKSLIEILGGLTAKHTGTQQATESVVSQLLWAAKGRTPHLYKAKPWGMTIPFWTDKFDMTTAYAVVRNILYTYSNWQSGRPTHSILQLSKGPVDLMSLCGCSGACTNAIIIGINRDYACAWWEAGYILLNLLVQAAALDISYEAVLLKNECTQAFKTAGIARAAVVFAC